MRRWACLLGFALCAVTDAIAHAGVDLIATPAWSGWTRAGRATEVDIRLSADVATRAMLDVVAGREVVRANVDLEPGRIERLQVPIESVEEVTVDVVAPAAPARRGQVRFSQSEAPLLGVALVTMEPVQLDGFHEVALAAADLPRNASAYASVDALILDGPTLRALDRRQLGALLAHAAQCGRVVLLNADRNVQRVLHGVGGCAGRTVFIAASIADAREQLQASLATIVPQISLVTIRDIAQPTRAAWNRVVVLLAVYFAIAALVFMLTRSTPIVALLPALATIAVLALLYAMHLQPQLVVWSDAESGAQVARYQAWQVFPALVRGHARVPVLLKPAAVRPCDPGESMRFELDERRGQAAFAEFDTRLFGQVSLCYSGMFPLDSAIEVDARPDGSLEIRNAGHTAIPGGVLVAGGVVHDMPSLHPGNSAIVRPDARDIGPDAATRIAMAQVPPDRIAALWELAPVDVADGGSESKAWLLLMAVRD